MVKFSNTKLYKYSDDGTCFLVRQIWKTRIPSRISFFAWEGSWECFLTIDNLEKRGNILINTCFLYKKDEETCKHVLLHCLVVYELWIIVYGLLGVS